MDQSDKESISQAKALLH